jgi:hypothetical protein
MANIQKQDNLPAGSLRILPINILYGSFWSSQSVTFVDGYHRRFGSLLTSNLGKVELAGSVFGTGRYCASLYGVRNGSVPQITGVKRQVCEHQH